LCFAFQVFKSCDSVCLTEEDTEYKVLCIKHVYASHVVFQFNCTNTISEQVLQNVSVAMDLAEAVSQARAVGTCDVCTGALQALTQDRYTMQAVHASSFCVHLTHRYICMHGHTQVYACVHASDTHTHRCSAVRMCRCRQTRIPGPPSNSLKR
jgi:hypothetical protein